MHASAHPWKIFWERIQKRKRKKKRFLFFSLLFFPLFCKWFNIHNMASVFGRFVSLVRRTPKNCHTLRREKIADKTEIDRRKLKQQEVKTLNSELQKSETLTTRNSNLNQEGKLTWLEQLTTDSARNRSKSKQTRVYTPPDLLIT